MHANTRLTGTSDTRSIVRATRRGVLGLASAALLARRAAAGAFPDHPIRLVVPYPPGAFNDTLARLVGDGLTGALGQPGMVENRAGAGGAIGTAAVAHAPADGYTLGVANLGTLAFNPFLYADPGYDPMRDFAPVCVAARLMNVLVASPESGITSVPELLERSRRGPGHLSYASSGAGSTPHLAMELLQRMTGMELSHVPYRGSAPAVSDLLGGRVPIMFDNVPNVLPYIQAGTMRALAVTGMARHPALPEVPTLDEAGVRTFEMEVWFGFVAPAATPAPVVAGLADAILGMVARPAMAERIRQQGAAVWTAGPAEFARLIHAELVRWGPIVRGSGARAD